MKKQLSKKSLTSTYSPSADINEGFSTEKSSGEELDSAYDQSAAYMESEILLRMHYIDPPTPPIRVLAVRKSARRSNLFSPKNAKNRHDSFLNETATLSRPRNLGAYTPSLLDGTRLTLDTNLHNNSEARNNPDDLDDGADWISSSSSNDGDSDTYSEEQQSRTKIACAPQVVYLSCSSQESSQNKINPYTKSCCQCNDDAVLAKVVFSIYFCSWIY
ncbi:unnamed protein product [Protopolystoma xenopodis]|uniref:Uncharacterized protein n=1 Tax=Protopolystoma xenopodis TaxID=117903 RepID=A0A3S5ATY2_9PLAT|nr:unnamed protein product [Protopolystoma xenopodis]